MANLSLPNASVLKLDLVSNLEISTTFVQRITG